MKRKVFKFVIRNGQLLTPVETEPEMTVIATIFMPLILPL